MFNFETSDNATMRRIKAAVAVKMKTKLALGFKMEFQ